MNSAQKIQSTLAKRTVSKSLPFQLQAAASLGILLVIALTAWLAVTPILTPPALVPSSAPAVEFSGERALQYLRVIASQPHMVGSPAQARVRDYLIGEIRALGLTPQVQEATAVLPGDRGVFASNLSNILVRIPGEQSTGAVAIMAHYDSQPTTTGASDNGAAAAGLLETMRAIQSGPRLRNDLIFVLTDAEEVDAQGADAFFWQHPWAKDIRVLVNFEAAGNSGASMLLETTKGNRGLLEGFARGVSHPVAYSFLTQLLTIMPLGTDMTVFAENGVPSLSPMFGWGYHTMYHSRLDNVDALDPRSIQHQGENGLDLARTFGSQDLNTLNTGEDEVFFSLFPGVFVHYPAGWAAPIALLTALCLVAVIFFSFRRRQFTVLGILGGVASTLALAIVPLILAAIAWIVIARLHPEFWRNLMGAPYQADLYLVGLVLLIVSGNLASLIFLRRKVSLPHLTLGAAILWFTLALLTSLALPGMSYLFTWPALITTLVLGVIIIQSRGDPLEGPAGLTRAQLVTRILGGAANILLVVPVITLLFMLIGFWFLMMTPSTPFILVPLLFVALLLGLIAPLMDLLVHNQRWIMPGFAAILAVALLGIASLNSGFSPDQPMQNGVWYAQDADTNAASWYSFGEGPADPWTAQFFPGGTEKVDPASLYPMFSDNPLPPTAFKGSAPNSNLPAPELTVTSDQASGEVRTIKLHLSSPRLARGLLVSLSGSPVLSAAVNGNHQTNPAWDEQKDWFMRFYGMTDQGIDLQLEVRPGSELVLAVTDQSDGLPDLPGVTYSPRSAAMMPFALAQEYMPFSDTTSVHKTYRLP